MNIKEYIAFDKNRGNLYAVHFEGAKLRLWSEEQQTITFPRHFALHMSTITFGALRGVIHAKTEELRQTIPLPSIDLTTMTEEDMTISTEDKAVAWAAYFQSKIIRIASRPVFLEILNPIRVTDMELA